jgi:hypothetical protein
MAPGDLIRQAQNEATLRFGPQRFALKELIAQALQARDMALHAAAGAERGIQASIAAARGETARTYAQAAQTTTGTRGLVDQTLANLGAGATPFAAAIARERGGATDRLTEGKANTLQELTQRRLEASSGRAFATQHATDQFNQDLGKVQRGYQEVASEQGAFVQGRTGELRKEAADRKFQRDLAELTQAGENKRTRITTRTTRRGQDLTHADTQAAIQQRRDAARKKAKEKTAANRPRSGVGSLTQGEENDVKDAAALAQRHQPTRRAAARRHHPDRLRPARQRRRPESEGRPARALARDARAEGMAAEEAQRGLRPDRRRPAGEIASGAPARPRRASAACSPPNAAAAPVVPGPEA